MIKHIFAGIFSCIVFTVSGQQFSFDTSSRWSATPALHPSSGTFDSCSAVGVYDSRIIHFVIAKDEIYMRTVYHRIVRINSDRGIEMFNKIYIPMYRESEVSGIRARTILPGGKVVDLPESKVKEIEEEGRRYKLFAMEGVERGAEIEYTYTIRRPMNPFGIEVFQDKSVPYEQVRFNLVAPAHLAFHVKGFNGFRVSSDSLIGEQRIIAGFDSNVPALEPEKYAVTDRYLRRVMYKMNYNLSSDTPEEMYTWKDFAKRALSAYTSLDEKEEKAMDKLADRIDISSASSEAEKILLIEDYIKRNFNIDDKLFGADVEDLDRVLKTRNTNRDGAVRMFAALFDRNRITYHLVFPSDRYSFPIEEDPENWNSVEQILFYFPKTGKYIDPEASSLRYPFIPPALAGG
ncbi:MAG TPA: DUF3857 domain-containing protein, partial [Chitinophagaceae bacterium]